MLIFIFVMVRIGLSYVSHAGPINSAEIVESAIIAERMGYESVWVPELYYNRECYTILGALAVRTKKLKLASSVVNPVTRHPSLIAMSAATLDELSGGRHILGLGTGGRIGAAVHGIPLEHKGMTYGSPVNRMRECIELVRRLLSGEKINFDGEFYKMENVFLEFKPLKRKIPIYLGQQGPLMMRLAGELADGVILTIISSEEYIRKAIKEIAVGASKAGRSMKKIDVASRIAVSMSSDGRRAIEAAKEIVARVLVHPGSKPVVEASGINLEEVKSLTNAVEKNDSMLIRKLVKNEWVMMLTASGTPQDCRRRIEEYIKAGVKLPLIVPIGKNYKEVIMEMSKIN